MKAHRMALATIVAVVLMSAATGAQWLNHPTPGIPRLPDGKPRSDSPDTMIAFPAAAAMY